MRPCARWIVEPPALPRIQNEAVPKLMAGDILGDDEQLLATLLTLRGKIEEQQAKLDLARERLDALPHRRTYLLLVLELGDRLLQGPARVARRCGARVAATEIAGARTDPRPADRARRSVLGCDLRRLR